MKRLRVWWAFLTRWAWQRDYWAMRWHRCVYRVRPRQHVLRRMTAAYNRWILDP